MLQSLLYGVAAFAALCLAMARHHEEALGRAPSERRSRLLRGLALLAFAGSCSAVLGRADAGIAWAAWSAQLSLAALVVVALASWRPRWLPACATAALLAAWLSSR